MGQYRRGEMRLGDSSYFIRKNADGTLYGRIPLF